MTSNIGNPDVTISPPIHNVPAADSPSGSLSPALITAEGRFLLDSFIGAVAIALGSVSILGVKPLAFLTAWGQALELKAQQALTNANNNTDGTVGAVAGTTSTGNSTTGIANFLTPELDLLHNLVDGVGTLYEDLSASIAGLSGRMSTVETTLAGGMLVGGFDDCSTVTRFTNVLGTMVSNGSSILSTSTAVAYHTDGPATILHGVIVQLSRKQQGLCRAIICADTGLTNYLALEFFTNGYGDDYARLAVGSGPNTVIELAQSDGTPVQWSGTINTNWVWEVYYSNAPIANTFYVVRNGTPVTELQYTDATNLVTHTSGTDIHVAWASNCNGNSVFKGCAVAGFNYEDRPL